MTGDPYTVVFFFDGDYGVECFVEKVFAELPGGAWDAAIEQARERGYLVDYEYATEVVTFKGHPEALY